MGPGFDAVRREIQLQIRLASTISSQWRELAARELAAGDADRAAEYETLSDEEAAIADVWQVALRAFDDCIGADLS